MSTPASSLLETVTRRTTVIERLSDAPMDKPALTGHLDVSRQTVDRSIRELEAAGLVERVRKEYRLTLFGTLAYGEFEALLDRFERLCLARDLLAHLPADTRIDAGVLAEADIVYADHRMPHEPIRKLEALVEDTDHLVGYSPISVPQYVSLFHHQITETDTEVELLLDEPLVEGLLSNYSEELHEALSSPDFTLYQLSESLCPNMGLALLDDSSVWIGVYDETGNIRGSITAETDAAVAWARDRLAECRENGREIFLRSPLDG